MEELWQTRIKDAFIKLSDFIESHKRTMPYDQMSVEFLTSAALLKKAETVDLKNSMYEVIVGSSMLDGKHFSNIELMKGTEPNKGGFMIFDSVNNTNLSGTFMKSDWVFRFVSKKTSTDGVVLPITSEIRIRSVLNNMIKRYTSDPKMRGEFIDSWYYSTSCLADAFLFYMNHYCLKEVSQEDRTIIKNKIPKACFDIKPLGNSMNMENIFKLVRNISNNDYAKSALSTVGVDPKMVDHFINATHENIGNIDIEGIKNQAVGAAQTGEIDGLGSVVKNLVSTVSQFMPSIDDDGEPHDQD